MIKKICMIAVLLIQGFSGIKMISAQENNPVCIKISGVAIHKNQFDDGLGTLICFKKKPLNMVIEEYKEMCLLAVEALNRNYEIDQRVVDNISRDEMTLLTKDNGLLYNRIITSNAIISQRDIGEMYEKTWKVLHADIYSFDEKELSDQFNTHKNIEKYEPYISMRNAQFAWPFDSFYKYREKLFYLEKGQFSGELYFDNQYHYLHITDISRREVNRNNYSLEKVKRILKHTKEISLVNEYHHKIFSEAKLKMFYKNINEYFKMSLKGGIRGKIPPEIGPNFLLETFTFNDQVFEVYVEDFVSYYNNLSFRYDVNKIDILKHYLKEMVFEKYALRDCEKLGLYDHPDFVAGRNNHLYEIMSRLLVEDLYGKEIEVTREEILSFYKKNIDSSKSLEQVHDYIKRRIRQQKLEQKKKELVAELKKKYTIVDNIDYDYYTSPEFLASISRDTAQ